MTTSAWTTATTEEATAKTSTIKRAQKRLDDVEQAGKVSFVVYGNTSLGDAYDRYSVSWTPDGWRCSCETHAGGQYRRSTCTHRLAVILWTKENQWDAPPTNGDTFAPTASADTETSRAGSPTSTDTRSGSTSPSDRLIPDVDDLSWGNPPFPDWFTAFRPHQQQAIAEILEAFNRGFKYVFLDAPTGSGKTIIGESVRRRVGSSAMYTCSTKALQDQFLEDFPYASIIKGRANYPTEKAADLFDASYHLRVTCDDCTWTKESGCKWCHSRGSCPYQCAKDEAAANPIVVSNTAYFLGETSGEASKFKGRSLAVIDECDLLENALMGFVEVRISEKRQKQFGIGPPQTKTRKALSNDWAEWVVEVIPKVKLARSRLPESPVDKRQVREAKYLDGLIQKLAVLRDGLENEEGTDWVYDGYQDGNIVFKPVKVDKLAGDNLWSKAQRFLLMSASIISPHEMVESLGIPDDEWEVVYVPSTFPKENRPVHRATIANVVSKNMDEAIPELADAIEVIAAEHPDDRILVHTVSYMLARNLNERLQHLARPLVTYTESDGKELAMETYLRHPNSIMLAPSMDRGVDLPGDACRVQVIAKVPFPYLGDKRISARLYSSGGQTWYQVQTVRTIVQMTGRGIRSKDDHAVTYILDKQFNKLYSKARRLFPDWWREAVISGGEALQMLKSA